MTNYNERLDEILHDIIHIGYVQGFNQIAHEARFAPYNHIAPITIEEAKQAHTSLMKELVAEAMPEPSTNLTSYEAQMFITSTEEYRQNLLKALEEV